MANRDTITPLVTFNFEGAKGDGWTTVSGTGSSVTTAQVREGAQSLLFNSVGASTTHNLTIANRIIAFSFYFLWETDASGTQSLLECDSGATFCLLQLRAGLKIRANAAAGVSVDSAALNLNQWYLIDGLLRTDSTTFSTAWWLDGVSQTGASTGGQVAADMTNFRLGNTGTNTSKWYADALVATTTAADAPIGHLLDRGMPIENGGYYA